MDFDWQPDESARFCHQARIWAFERVAPPTKQPLILMLVRFWRAGAIVPPKRFVIVITISEVLLKDAERTYEEFFREEFRSQRLGSEGYWLGRGTSPFEFEGTVSRATFRNLVQGMTPDSGKILLPDSEDPNRPAFWQIDLCGSQSHSVLWAMSPEKWRDQVESVHIMAAICALRCFQTRAIDLKQGNAPGAVVAPMSAFFLYAASHDYTPQLKMTAFVLTHSSLKDGTAQKLTAGDLHKQNEKMSWFYTAALISEFVDLIGPFRAIEGIRELRIGGVPQELVRRFYFDPAFNRDLGFEKNTKYLVPELFAKWQAQGERFGWGVKQAEALLRESNRQKYWNDLKADWRSKVRQTAQRVNDWKESWKPKTKQPDSPQQEKASSPKVEGHKHSH